MKILVLVFIVTLSICEAKGFSQWLVQTWRLLGWKQVHLVTDIKQENTIELFKLANLDGISVQTSSNFSWSTVYNVMLVRNTTRTLNLKQVQSMKPYSLMVVTTRKDEKLFDKLFESINYCLGLLKAVISSNELMLYRYQTSRTPGKIIQNRWVLDQTKNYYIETYDMEGEEIRTNNLPWQPWIHIFNCSNGHLDCLTSGIGHEGLEALSKLYNFTVMSDKELTGKWGSVPRSGSWEDPSPEFEGMTLAIHKGQYDMSTAPWVITYGRAFHFDQTFSFINLDSVVLVNTKEKLMDFTLFLRPFALDSWAGILMCLIVIGLFLTGRHCLLLRYLARETSGQVLSLTSWVFFLLISSYYCGALTMFLSSPPSLPFTSLVEGLSKHPTWKLIIIKGTENSLLLHPENDNEVVKNWISRMKSNPEKYIASNTSELFCQLSKPGLFTFINEAHAYHHLNEQYNDRLQLEKIGNPVKTRVGFLLTKNSPYTRMFDRGITKLRQNGVLNSVLKPHIKKIHRASRGEAEAVALGNMNIGIGFLVYFGFILFVALLLLAEIVIKYFGSFKVY